MTDHDLTHQELLNFSLLICKDARIRSYASDSSAVPHNESR